mgnify:CR=1 FL=1|tara:strand:+ start:647 stop:946 length:300 start_codon:yes stop_codon:yes gene_type:complete
MKGVTITTVHFAHLCIVPIDSKTRDELELSGEIDAHLNELLEKYTSEPSSPSGVEPDDQFRCHLLTEVGLKGTNLDDLTAVVNALAEWVNQHPHLELVG